MRNVLAYSLLAIMVSSSLVAAPSRNRNYQQPSSGQEQPKNSPLRDFLLNIRHQMTNQEEEIRKLRERLDNDARAVDSVREDTEKLQDFTRTALRDHSETLDTATANFKANHEHLHQDLQQLQQYANSVKELMEQYHRRIQSLEVSVDRHTAGLKSLEAAVQSLIEAFPTADKATAQADDSVYRIVDGDTLEKIARRNHTTIRRIKEVNGLTSDRIIVGQKLKIPPSENAP